jgi:hypothetical protein
MAQFRPRQLDQGSPVLSHSHISFPTPASVLNRAPSTEHSWARLDVRQRDDATC